MAFGFIAVIDLFCFGYFWLLLKQASVTNKLGYACIIHYWCLLYWTWSCILSFLYFIKICLILLSIFLLLLVFSLSLFFCFFPCIYLQNFNSLYLWVFCAKGKKFLSWGFSFLWDLCNWSIIMLIMSFRVYGGWLIVD